MLVFLFLLLNCSGATETSIIYAPKTWDVNDKLIEEFNPKHITILGISLMKSNLQEVFKKFGETTIINSTFEGIEKPGACYIAQDDEDGRCIVFTPGLGTGQTISSFTVSNIKHLPSYTK